MSITKTIDVEARVDKAEKDLEGVAKSVKKIDNNLEEVKESTRGVSKGVKGIGNALKTAGIGLAIAAFAKLTEVFNENQKVTDAFNTAFEALSLAFNDFFNFLDRNVGTVIDYFKGLFQDPVQSLKNFGQAIVDNVIERVKSALDALGFLGDAVVKVFKGDFAGAADSAKNAGKELFDVVTGVNNTFDKVTEVIPKVVGSITDYAKSTLKAAQETVELNKNAEIAAVINQGLIEKYDRQAEQQRQIRDEERNTIQQRIEANNKLNAILDEQSEKMLENVEITIEAARREYEKNKNQENYIALLEATNEKEAVLAQIEGFRSEQKMNDLALSRELNELKESELETRNEIAISEMQFQADSITGELERLIKLREIADEEYRIELERLENKKSLYKEGTQAFQDAQNEINKLNQEQSEKERELDKLTANAKVDVAQQTFANLKSIFGENSKVGKAAAIAETVINTYKSATAAYASMSGIPLVGPALGAIAAGAAVAAGIANVKKIKQTGDPVSGGGSEIQAQPQAPDFNVVGAAPENQLAEVIGEQQQKPVKAFVVSNEVSSQQALDRNIESSAALG